MGKKPLTVKICGLRDAPSVRAAIDAGADWLGFVFVSKSPRYLKLDAAQTLATHVPPGPQIVGLFADQSASGIADIARRVPLDKVQLHGRETPDDIVNVRSAVARPVIAARAIGSAADLTSMAEIHADYFLLDARPPAAAAIRGGHGAAFDWDLLSTFEHETPWLLAGGLTPNNVADAIAVAKDRPGFAGVDVSSGVEAEKGVKDPQLIGAFVEAARRALR